MSLDEGDLKIELIQEKSSGGQHAGMPAYLIQVTHIPTNLKAIVDGERSQHRTRRIAMSMIEWGLSEMGYRKEQNNDNTK